jgi:phosphatidylglycerol---prolipoprotein diacylglyceryl transferase
VPRANNKKTNRRGTTAARSATARAQRDGGQASPPRDGAQAPPASGGQAPRAGAPAGSDPQRADGTRGQNTSGTSSQNTSGTSGRSTSSTSSQNTASTSGRGTSRTSGRGTSGTSGGARKASAGTAPAGTASASLTAGGAVPPGLKRGGAASPLPDGDARTERDLGARVAGGSVRPAPVRLRGKTDAEVSGSGPGAGAESVAVQDKEPDDMPAWAAKAVEEMLTVTYWLDPGENGEEFGATIRFTGRRLGVTGKSQPGDTFAQEETVNGLLPGSGPIAVTAEVRGINSGEWSVTARSVARATGSQFRSYPSADQDGSAHRVPLPRRVPIPAEAATTVRTRSLLFTRVPGIVRYAYASLVFLGVLVGLAVEALLLNGHHYAVLEPLLISAGAVAAGIVGGKAWYIAVQRGKKFDGWCVQGFITGTGIVVAAAALAGPGVPAGVYLGVTACALLFGMAIGRPGCFWAGCCVGRATSSRWGIWASDRKVGCRREPAQLLEALASLVIGGAVLAVVLLDGLPRSGPVAVAGLAAYTLVRQFILSLRAEPPERWRYGRQLTIAAAAVALIVSVVLLARG